MHLVGRTWQGIGGKAKSGTTLCEIHFEGGEKGCASFLVGFESGDSLRELGAAVRPAKRAKVVMGYWEADDGLGKLAHRGVL